MSTFQPKRCPTDFKFCSNWTQNQKVQYKACIPQSRTCYDNSKSYELEYRTPAESCKKTGKGDVCPYSNYDWARLLNGFTVVDSCPPLKSDSVLSKKSSDARLFKAATSRAFNQKLRCTPLKLKWSGKLTARGSIENLTYVWTKFLAEGGAGHIHLFSEENGKAPDVVVKLLVGSEEVCASSRKAVCPDNKMDCWKGEKTDETENVWGPKLAQEECPHILLQRCITPKGGYSYKGKDYKLVVMEDMSNDVDQLLEDDRVQKHLSPSIRDDLIWKVFQALKCIWSNNGVYPDLKPANVMIRCLSPSGQVKCVDNYKSVDFDNMIVKLIDLDSICFFSGSLPRRADMIPKYTGGEYASYKPPYAWPPSALDWECNEVTNIWNMAIFALLVLCPTEAVYKKFSGPLWTGAKDLCFSHFHDELNELFEDARDLIEDAQKTSKLDLSNLIACFAPNPCNYDDWRRCSALKNNCTSSHDPPFLFEQMFHPQYEPMSDDGFARLRRQKKKRKRESDDEDAMSDDEDAMSDDEDAMRDDEDAPEPSQTQGPPKKARDEGPPKSKQGFQCIGKCTGKEVDYGYFTKTECGCKTAPYKGKIYGTWEWDECDQTYCE